MNQHDFRQMMLDDLRQIIGSDDLPPVFEAADYPRPLAVGIHEALAARYPQAKRYKLTRWIHVWCGRRSYARAVAAGGMRFDLDGARTERVSEVHRAAAKARLAVGKDRPKTVGKGGRPILRLKRAAHCQECC